MYLYSNCFLSYNIRYYSMSSIMKPASFSTVGCIFAASYDAVKVAIHLCDASATSGLNCRVDLTPASSWLTLHCRINNNLSLLCLFYSYLSRLVFSSFLLFTFWWRNLLALICPCIIALLVEALKVETPSLTFWRSLCAELRHSAFAFRCF